MKKIRRIKIKLQTSELVIFRRGRRDTEKNSEAEDKDSIIRVCPLCQFPFAFGEAASTEPVCSRCR